MALLRHADFECYALLSSYPSSFQVESGVRLSMKRLLKPLVSLAVLLVALYFLDWRQLFATFRKINPWMFLLATLISLSQYLVCAFRWHLLARDVTSLSLREHAGQYLYATFLNTFTPANLGGDIYRFISLKNYGSTAPQVTIVLLRERFLGLMSLFLSFLLCLFVLYVGDTTVLANFSKVLLVAGGCIAVGAGLLFISPLLITAVSKLRVVRSHRWMVSTLDLLGTVVRFDSPVSFFILIAVSLVAFGIWIVTGQVVAFDLETVLPWSILGAVLALVELARLVPMSVQGVGVREGAFAYLFGLMGKSTETGFVLGTVLYLSLGFSFLLAGFLGWSLLWTSAPKAKKANPIAKEH